MDTRPSAPSPAQQSEPNSVPPTIAATASPAHPQPTPPNRPLSSATPGSTTSTTSPTVPPPNAISGPRGWQPGGKWDCAVCQRSFKPNEKADHLMGKPHRKRLVACEEAEKKRIREELARESAETRSRSGVGMPESSRSATGIQSACVEAVAQGAPARPELWECVVCERTMMSMSKASHLSGNLHGQSELRREMEWQKEKEKEVHKLEQEEVRKIEPEIEREELRRTERIRIEEQKKKDEEEQMRIAEEVRKDGEKKRRDIQRIEEIRAKEERRKNEEAERVEFQRVEMIRIEEERRENEEAKRIELQRIEEIRVAEEKRQNEETERVEMVRIEEERRENEEAERFELQRIEEERRQNEETERVEMVRIEEERRENKEVERVELLRAEKTRIEEDIGDNEHAKYQRPEMIRVEEQYRMRVEQLRINDEESNRVRKAKLEQETVAAADKELRITQENERAEWMREQAEAAVAARQMEGQLRIEQEDRRKEWLRKQEAQASAAWRMEEQHRIEEEKRRKEWMRKQEEQASAAWRMEGQLRIEEESRRRQWFGNQEEEAAAAWQMGQYLRLEQQNSRKESTRKLAEAAATAAAAEHTRREQFRKQEEEAAWQKQELQIVEERENAQRLAEQVQVELERRRMEDVEQQQVTDRLAREQVEHIHNISSPGSSIGPTGWLQQGTPNFQYTSQGASIYGSGSQSAYLQWQEMMQEMHQQQLWLPQHVTLSFPIPITFSSNLPPILYRVYDETSVSKYFWDGFTAASSFMPQDAFHFGNMVNLHGNWSSREGTPFISVTSSPEAVAWHVGIRQASRNQPNIMVALIDTAALLGPCQTTVWKMHDARDHFGLQPWKCHRRAFDNEYICALRIPARAIFACCKPNYFVQNAQMFLDGMERDRIGPVGKMDRENMVV